MTFNAQAGGALIRVATAIATRVHRLITNNFYLSHGNRYFYRQVHFLDVLRQNKVVVL